MYITPGIENVLILSLSVLICWGQWLYNSYIDKTGLRKKIKLGVVLLKFSSAVGFSGKSTFLKSVCFHHEMLCVTYF